MAMSDRYDEIRNLAKRFYTGELDAAYVPAELRGLSFRAKIPYNDVLLLFLRSLQVLIQNTGSKGGESNGDQ